MPTTTQQKIYNKALAAGSPDKAPYNEFLAEFGYQAMRQAKDRCFIETVVLDKYGRLGVVALNPPPPDRRSDAFEEFYQEFSQFVISSPSPVPYRDIKRAFGGNVPRFYRAVTRFSHEHRPGQPVELIESGVGFTRCWTLKTTPHSDERPSPKRSGRASRGDAKASR